MLPGETLLLSYPLFLSIIVFNSENTTHQTQQCEEIVYISEILKRSGLSLDKKYQRCAKNQICVKPFITFPKQTKKLRYTHYLHIKLFVIVVVFLLNLSIESADPDHSDDLFENWGEDVVK